MLTPDSMSSFQWGTSKGYTSRESLRCRSKKKTQTSVGHIPPAGSPRQHRAAGPGISRMLPEEMLIHVNTSPLKAYRVCCWGSWEYCSLPSKKQLQVQQLASAEVAPTSALAPTTSAPTGPAAHPPTRICHGIHFTVSTAEGKVLSPE